MIPFTYAKAGDVAEAVRLGGAAGAKFLGGGTNLVDLMRETVERPAALVDVTGLSSTIEQRPDGGNTTKLSGSGQQSDGGWPGVCGSPVFVFSDWVVVVAEPFHGSGVGAVSSFQAVVEDLGDGFGDCVLEVVRGKSPPG